MLIAAVALLSLMTAAGLGFVFGWLWLPAGFFGSLVVLGLLAFLFLCCAAQSVDLSQPQEADSPFFRNLMYVYEEAIFMALLTRIRVRGMGKLPKDGRFLLVCNHISDLDPLLLHVRFRDSQLSFISKHENRDLFIVGGLMHKTLCQLINRENDREGWKTILRCIWLLRSDQCSIAAFPEGYTSLDGKLHPFRNGLFKIAHRAGVPIVVCTVRGTNHIFRNARRLRPTEVRLHLLDVIRPEEHMTMNTVELGARIHAMMLEDLGPEFKPD